MLEKNKKLILKALTILLFLVFLATGYYFFIFKDKIQQEFADSNDRNKELTNESLVYPKPKEAFSLPKYTGAPIGIISEDAIVSGTYSQETKFKLKNELSDIAEMLSYEPDNLENLLRAGVIKKFFGDYLGARDLWEYASLVRPKNSTSYANLAGLYALYISDFKKAEFNYKKAIENSPGDIYLYTGLADLYQNYALSEIVVEEVEKTIKTGLGANPENTTLILYLARFYKERGEISRAIEFYEKVLKLDPENEAVKNEIAVLKAKKI